jgi:uncharacterized membrane protein
VIVVIVILLLGLAIAFYRAKSAEAIACTLQQRLKVLEERLARVETSLASRQVSGPQTVVEPPSAETATAAADSRPFDVAARPASPEPSAASHAPGPAPVAPTPTHTTPDTPHPAPRSTDLEAIIGGRWLLFAGIAAVVLGISYFVKFAFDNGWISEPLRVVAGLVAGALLIAGGMRFWSRGLPLFGHALAGAGVLVLYVAIYAALHFYGLIPAAVAFVLMVVVTVFAVFLADRQRAQPLAALGFIGGFATPLLAGGDADSPVMLFTYMGLLIGGTAVVMQRHAWPLLGAVSYLCTFVLVLAWCFASFRDELWLTTELFLTAYVALFAFMLLAIVRTMLPSPKAYLAAAILAIAPLTYHMASMLLLGRRPAAWLVYVVLFTLAWLVVSHRTRAAWVRVLVLLLVGLPMAVWLADLQYPRWYGAGVGTLLALYALHLAVSWEDAASTGEPPLSAWAVAHAQINGLLLPMSLYLFLDERAAAWNPWMAAGLGGWNALLSVLAKGRAPGLRIQFIIVAGTLAAAAVVLAFDGPAVAVGWMVEGIFIGWLAARERRRPLALGSAALIGLAVLQIFDLLATPLPVGQLPAVNPRAFAAAMAIGGLAWLAWRIREDPAAAVRNQARTTLIVLANLLALALLSAEIHAFFGRRALGVSGDDLRAIADAGRAEQVTLSVAWALYAVVLVFTGIRRRFAPARYLAIGLFAVVIVKVLYVDIAGLDRVYRMLSVLGVGILLLVASYLYQRRTQASEES